MNKTPHEQCAEEIREFYEVNWFIVLTSDEAACLATILTKHFPQPTSTSSLDASLLAEVERLKALNFDQRELLNGQDKQEIYLSTEISKLEKKLSTADRTGYERGVREAAEIPLKMGESEAEYKKKQGLLAEGFSQLKQGFSAKQAILNLLNKKD